MVYVTAATSFLGNEGMWRAGDTKQVSNDRAHELLMLGHVIEAADQTAPAEPEPSALDQVAAAIGATVAESTDSNLPAVAEAIGATVAEKPTDEMPAVTLDSLKKEAKEEKDKGQTKEEKAKVETKEAK